MPIKTFTLDSTKMENQKDRDSTSGRVGLYIKESSSKAASMAKDFGRNQKQTQNLTPIKVSILMTKNTGKAISSGRAATTTSEDIITI